MHSSSHVVTRSRLGVCSKDFCGIHKYLLMKSALIVLLG
jgi:hypothetical protein